MTNIFVTAASGHIGKPLIPLLLQSKGISDIVLPTTNAARLSSQAPSSDRITILEGSIQDPGWVEQQLVAHKINTVVICLVGADELFTTCNFLSSVVRSGCVKHVIYISACGDLVNPEHALGDLLDGLVMPGHVLIKTAAEQMLQQSKWFREEGRTYTALGPSLFYTNDERGKESMMGPAAVYGEPIGKVGVSRVDVEDIALAVVKVAEEPEKWNRQKVMIGSRKLYTEDDFCKLWSEGLGKKISIMSNDPNGLDQFEKHCGTALGPAWGRDLRLMYELFGKLEFGMTDEEYEVQKRLLGKEPSDYEKWVASKSAEWKKEALQTQK